MKTGVSCLFILLLLGASAAAHAQQQSIDIKQQSKQTQRMFRANVHRDDTESTLEDPAVANELTYEQTLPDSNEQNVSSRESTIDNIWRPRFVPAPVPSEGMQFVPGRGYVAGSIEEATEPGLSRLSTSLSSQPAGGLAIQQGQSASELDPYAGSATPFEPLDHLGSEIGHDTDPLQRRVDGKGLRSPLLRPLQPNSPMQQFSPSEPRNQAPEYRVPFASGEHSTKIKICDSDLDLSNIHDPAILQRLKQSGCLKNAVSEHDAPSSRGIK